MPLGHKCNVTCFSVVGTYSLLYCCFVCCLSTPVIWNSVTSVDAKQLECIQQKFVALCYNQFSSQDHNGYSYATAYQLLSLCTLHERRLQLGALFVISTFVFHTLPLRCVVCQLVLLKLPSWQACICIKSVLHKY